MVLRPTDACIELLGAVNNTFLDEPFYRALLEFEPTLTERIKAHPVGRVLFILYVDGIGLMCVDQARQSLWRMNSSAVTHVSCNDTMYLTDPVTNRVTNEVPTTHYIP